MLYRPNQYHQCQICWQYRNGYTLKIILMEMQKCTQLLHYFQWAVRRSRPNYTYQPIELIASIGDLGVIELPSISITYWNDFEFYIKPCFRKFDIRSINLLGKNMYTYLFHFEHLPTIYHCQKCIFLSTFTKKHKIRITLRSTLQIHQI